jgi:hypothetical protein
MSHPRPRLVTGPSDVDNKSPLRPDHSVSRWWRLSSQQFQPKPWLGFRKMSFARGQWRCSPTDDTRELCPNRMLSSESCALLHQSGFGICAKLNAFHAGQVTNMRAEASHEYSKLRCAAFVASRRYDDGIVLRTQLDRGQVDREGGRNGPSNSDRTSRRARLPADWRLRFLGVFLSDHLREQPPVVRQVLAVNESIHVRLLFEAQADG